MLGGLSPAGVNVGLRAVRVVEARLVVRVSGRVGEVRVARVRTVSRAADDSEAEAVDLGGTDSEILSVLKTFAHWQRSQPVGTTRRDENQAVKSSRARADSVSGGRVTPGDRKSVV